MLISREVSSLELHASSAVLALVLLDLGPVASALDNGREIANYTWNSLAIEFFHFD